MLFKIGVLSLFHFVNREKLIEQIESGNAHFDIVLFNCTQSNSSLLEVLQKKKIKFLGYTEKNLMTAELVNSTGLNHLIELPFTNERLHSKLNTLFS